MRPDVNDFRPTFPRVLGPLLLVLVACSGRSTERTLFETSSAGAGGDPAGVGGAATSGGAPGAGGQAAFTLESSAFSDRGSIGAQYQCGATGKSPPLSWTAGPAGTQSYAVVMTGPDRAGASSYYHWIIWDIPPTTSALPEGVAQMTMPPEPAGSSQISPAVDGSTWPGYSGPCPLLPDTPFVFMVFALEVATLPAVTSDSAGADVFAAIHASMLESAELTGLATHYRS